MENNDTTAESTLTEGQEAKITITIENGDVVCAIEADGSPSTATIIGAIEIAKAEILGSVMAPQVEATPEMEFVTIELTQDDFDMDGGEGELTAKGHKVGDRLEVPAQIAMLREQAIKQMNASKQ